MLHIEDIKKEIKLYNLEAIVGEEGDSVIEGCIKKATIWLRAKLRTYSVQIDLDNEVIKQALIKRTLYELYSYAENEEIARDKAKDAVELLRAEFGSNIEGEGYAGKGQPVIHVAKGSDTWRGFKE
ncbi:MAG TPA: hypothetical protein PKU94_07665 [Candidatus Hydrothermia bacterium]|nr:hypothetical protein [Candidatus Hydrothermia bacterium]